MVSTCLTLGLEQSWRHGLESLGYVLLYLARGPTTMARSKGNECKEKEQIVYSHELETYEGALQRTASMNLAFI